VHDVHGAVWAKFPDEEAWQDLSGLKALAHGVRCPRCRHKKVFRLKERCFPLGLQKRGKETINTETGQVVTAQTQWLSILRDQRNYFREYQLQTACVVPSHVPDGP